MYCRWHKAAGDASKRAARLQAEAKAAAAQSDTAQAAARQADHLATCLKMTTAHLQAASSPPQVLHHHTVIGCLCDIMLYCIVAYQFVLYIYFCGTLHYIV